MATPRTKCSHSAVKFHTECLTVYHRIFAFFGMTLVKVVRIDNTECSPLSQRFRLVLSNRLIVWAISLMIFRTIYSILRLTINAEMYLETERNLGDVAVFFICIFRIVIMRMLGVHMTWENRNLCLVVLKFQLFSKETHAKIMHRTDTNFDLVSPPKKFSRWEWTALILLTIEISLFILELHSEERQYELLWILIPGHILEGATSLLFAFSVSSWMKNLTSFVRMLRESLPNSCDSNTCAESKHEETGVLQKIIVEKYPSHKVSNNETSENDMSNTALLENTHALGLSNSVMELNHDEHPPSFESLNYPDHNTEFKPKTCCYQGNDDEILKKLSKLQELLETLDDIKGETIEHSSTCLTLGVLSMVTFIITDSFNFFDMMEFYGKMNSLASIFVYLCTIAVMTSGPGRFVSEIDLFRKGLRKLFRCNDNIAVSLRVNQLNECLQTLSCSQVWGFFELGNNILVPILSFVATYVIILLEMRGEPLEKYFGILNSTKIMKSAFNSQDVLNDW